MFPRVDILENDVRMDEYRGFRIQHCACSVNGCYRISIILAFLCGRAKKIQIRFVWMRTQENVHKSCENVSFRFCTDQKDVAKNVYKVDQELGGGELSLSARKKK